MYKTFRTLFNSNWHREAVGGLWDQIGKLQFDFLVAQGLKPYHNFLDVSCGSLRGGIHFIPYLEKGRYVGFDNNKKLLKAGIRELKKNNVLDKKPTLLHIDNFDLSSLNTKVDYAIAQSLFTHLTINEIIQCVVNIDRILVTAGKFFATFFENPEGKENLVPIKHETKDSRNIVTFFSRDPFHYNFETFKWVCENTNLDINYIGDWNHPRDQKMLVFTKK